MAHPWSRTSQMFWDDALDYSAEDSAGPGSSPCATLPTQPEPSRLFGTVNNLLNQLGPFVSSFALSPTRPMFHGEVLDDDYDPSHLDDPTHDPTLTPQGPTFRNDDHDENVELKMEDEYLELDDRTTGHLGGSLPTPPLGTRPSLSSISTLGERIASLQVHLLPTPTLSPVTTRRPPTSVPTCHQYSTPNPPMDTPSSPSFIIQEVQHAEGKHHHRRWSSLSTSRDQHHGKTEYLSPAAQRRLQRSAGPASRSRFIRSNNVDITAVQTPTNPFLETSPFTTSSPFSIKPPLATASAAHYEIVLTPPPSSDELLISMPTPAPKPIKLTIDTRSPKKMPQSSPGTPSPLKGPSLSRKRRREEGQYPALLFIP